MPPNERIAGIWRSSRSSSARTGTRPPCAHRCRPATTTWRIFAGSGKTYSGAKALYAKSIGLHDSLPPPQRETEDELRSHAFALKRLGAILVAEGSLNDGEARYQAALALDEQMIARHPDDARYRYDITFSMNDLALIASKRGDDTRAESMWNRALAIRQTALAADPKNVRTISGIAYIRGALGNLYLPRKQFAEAIAQFREEIRVYDGLVAVAGPLSIAVRQRAVGAGMISSGRCSIARKPGRARTARTRRPRPLDG